MEELKVYSDVLQMFMSAHEQRMLKGMWRSVERGDTRLTSIMMLLVDVMKNNNISQAFLEELVYKQKFNAVVSDVAVSDVKVYNKSKWRCLNV